MKISVKTFLILILLQAHTLLHAQYKVRFVVDSVPSYQQSTDKIYLAGSFNNWNAGDENSVLKNHGHTWEIIMELPAGIYEYKFTRGNWNRGEVLAKGQGMDNRKLKLEQDTTIHVNIEAWADHFPKKEKMSTASKQVHLLDTAFFIPQLNRYRRIWIYLPASYEGGHDKYPVLYMHDGQNLFDDLTSGYGEWGVDEALDSLGPANRDVIVVGIDHGGDKRVNEYAPYDMERFGKGEGDAYLNFLVKTLKPWIDRHYRTKKGRKNTFVAGSSVGGLISFYAVLKYPKVFGGAGVFSPSFWINPQFKHIDPKKAKKVKSRIYFYAGQQESEEMVPDMLSVYVQMRLYSKSPMTTVIRGEGRHNEASWRKEFPLFYEWTILRKEDRSRK